MMARVLGRAFGAAIIALALVIPGVVRAQGATPEYRLGAGDAIRITVFQNPDLTLETRVGGDGTITYPLIGTIRIGGLSVSEAEKAIARALQTGNFIKQPQVTILVTQVRSQQVSVLGEVGKPGSYPLDNLDTHVSAVIALAGGILPAGGDVVVLTGEREGKSYRKEIDVPALFIERNSRDDIIVHGGDVIYVPRAPVFYIYGEVLKPGAYRVERGMTMREALAQGGGLTPRGTERDLRVYRRGADGTTTSITPKLDDQVRPGDVLRIGQSLF